MTKKLSCFVFNNKRFFSECFLERKPQVIKSDKKSSDKG